MSHENYRNKSKRFKAMGRPVSSPPTAAISVRIAIEKIEKLRTIADGKDHTLSNVAADVIKRDLDQEKVRTYYEIADVGIRSPRRASVTDNLVDTSIPEVGLLNSVSYRPRGTRRHALWDQHELP